MTEKMSRPQPPRPAMPSAPTWQLELSPAFTEALRSVAPPKPRRRVLPYVVALGVIAVIAGIVFGRNALAAQHGTDAATLEKLPATQTITSQAITIVETPAAPSSPV